MDERTGSMGVVLDDRWDESYPQTPHPPNQLLDEGDQSTYGLIAPLRDAARTMDPVEILARAAQAFTFAETDAETTLDRAAARTRGRAFADLAVTGRGVYAAFQQGVDRVALDAQTRALLAADGMTVPADTQVAAAIDQALDRAYAVAWALNGPAAQQAGWRAPLGWIAVSSEDDKARRPVNVPAPPYEQYEVAVPCAGLVLQTRFFVASSEPPAPVPVAPLPRDVPPDPAPTVPAGHEVILFLHGHASGAEEAVEIIPHLLAEAARRGRKYAIIAFDLPSNGYSESVDHTAISPTASTTYPRLPTDSGPIATPVLDFIEDFVVAFVDALDAVTPIKDRVAAVIGGSLGGNLGLRLGRRDTANGTDTPWLRNCSIVAWSPASRRWHWRVAGEQLVYSHQDNVVHGDANTPVRYTQNTVRTLLAAGGEDNYIGTHIFDNTMTVGRAMTCPGYLLRVPGTGHSIHFERPGFFARKIIDFIAGKSMEITCVTTKDGKIQAVGGTNHTDAVPFRMSADDCMEAILGGDEFFVTDAAGVPARVRITNTTPRPFLGDPGGRNLGYFLKTIADSSVGNNLDELPECP